jgi:general secretion pathway protein E
LPENTLPCYGQGSEHNIDHNSESTGLNQDHITMAELATKQVNTRVLDLQNILHDLQADGRVSEEDAQRLLIAQRSREQAASHPLNYIAQQNLSDQLNPGQALSLNKLLEWLSDKSGQPVFNIDPLKMNVPAITSIMSYAFAKRHKILAVEDHRDYVVVASSQPFIDGWEEDLSHVLRKPIRRVLADPELLERYTVEFYMLTRSVSSADGAGQVSAASFEITNFEQMLELGQLKDPDANDQHIVNIVDWLLQYAFDQRASDIHLEPRREKGIVRFRIDGVLHEVYGFPLQVVAAITSRIKILGRMNLAEKRKPQDGRLKTVGPEGNEVELRLSTIPTAFGEKLVMRIFDPDVLLRSFEDLGLANEDYERWQGMTSKPTGIVLVTGPTGSGKTTTLYSTLKQLATTEVNVCSIEDPIEMVEPSFNQMQVQPAIQLDFAAGVRALMRQDPDIIMIGEIRDLETAEMAIQAALTGHLVISTLHTNDSPTAITRLLELGVPSYLIKATLLGVMAQRLVRTLCPHCKQEAKVEQEAWEQLTRPWKAVLPPTIYQPVGCLECRNTGYLGRQGIYEILSMSESLQVLLEEDFDVDKLRKAGIRSGMRTLRLSGAQKVAAGDTTIEEVMRVAPASQLKI